MHFFNGFQSRIAVSICATATIIVLSGAAGAEEGPGTVPNETTIVAYAPMPVTAQQPQEINREYVTGYVTDTVKILTSPVTWDYGDWLKAGLVIGATSGIYFADTDIRNFAQRHQSSFRDKSASVGNALGNPLYALPPLALFYLYGTMYDDSKARRASLLAAESFAISGAFTCALKMATQRPRPFTGETATTWNGPGSGMSDDSFPSLHTTAAFSIATVLAEEYSSNPYIPPLAYGLATLTGLSRIYDNKHWASDVFFGGAIGYFVGKAVIRYHSPQTSSNAMILPTASRHGFGVTAEYRF